MALSLKQATMKHHAKATASHLLYLKDEDEIFLVFGVLPWMPDL